MSNDNKKLLWVAISVCAFVLILIGVGFFLFTPRKAQTASPASIQNVLPGKESTPSEYYATPQYTDQSGSSTIEPSGMPGGQSPYATPAPSTPGGVIVITPPGQTQPANQPIPEASTAARPSQAAPSPPHSAPAAAPKAVAPVAKAPAPKAAPAKPVATVAKPVTKVVATTPVKQSWYWIQAASFSSPSRADALKAALADQGIASLVSTKLIEEKTWYRVRIGPYPSNSEAADWLVKIHDIDGCAAAYVTKTVETK